MKNYFVQVKTFIESNYGHMGEWRIVGENYPAPFHGQIIAQITSYIWLIGIALLVAGSQIFKLIGIPEPRFMQDINNNKMVCFIILYFLNSFGAGQLATGAFEIQYDDLIVFSKLDSNRLPSADDIVKMVELITK